MKKIFLTLALAFFAFAGVYAQETETETQTEDPMDQQLEEAVPEEAAPEEGMLEEEADALQGKTRVTFEELPVAVQDAVTAAGFEEMEIIEAYEVDASASGDAEVGGEQAGEAGKAKYEIHVNKDNKTKVLTFDESGEKVKNKDKKDKW